jgi:hypothetical protein
MRNVRSENGIVDLVEENVELAGHRSGVPCMGM